MIPELGHFALIIALCLAMVLAVLPLTGATRGVVQWMATARPIAHGQTVFLLIAFACLTFSFIENDFSVKYVATNSNTALPLAYRIAAVWGAHEGSLLLWATTLGIWTSAVALFSRSLPMAMVARVLSVMGMISVGFLLFTLLTSSPFERLFPIPMEGRDLNPLLQDPGLVIHPPMLYMGYVGFSVAFAFATAALISGHLDAAWARWSRPWTTVAWIFLTIGISLGSWWAYYELGWGGWWFWDPVENASFLPWLVGTALIHSLAVTEKRGAFKSWTVLLALSAFSLSLLGTFLVRSGVLTSVHAFATDPTRGLFILMFLGAVVGGSLGLYAWRGPSIRAGGSFKASSKETMLLLNNVLLVVAAACVLLGTLYPLILDALGLGKISVGPPFFETVFTPIMLLLVFLIGIGPAMRWKKQELGPLFQQLKWPAVISLVLSLFVIFALPKGFSIGVFVSLLAAIWITLTTLQYLYKHIGAKNNWWTGLRTTGLATYGMSLAHLGVAMFIVGVAITSAYSIEKDVRLAPNESYQLGAYRFIFSDVTTVTGPNYEASELTLHVYKNNKHIVDLYPQKRVYRVQQNPMTEAAIDAGFFRDIYVAMGDPLDNGAWAIRLYYKPFIRWIWLGTILMALGGLLAAADRRYRVHARRQVSKQAMGTEAETT